MASKPEFLTEGTWESLEMESGHETHRGTTSLQPGKAATHSRCLLNCNTCALTEFPIEVDHSWGSCSTEITIAEQSVHGSVVSGIDGVEYVGCVMYVTIYQKYHLVHSKFGC